METMTFIIIGVIVGLIAVGSSSSPSPRETQIVFIPIEAGESSPAGLGCVPLIMLAALVLLVISSTV